MQKKSAVRLKSLWLSMTFLINYDVVIHLMMFLSIQRATTLKAHERPKRSSNDFATEKPAPARQNACGWVGLFYVVFCLPSSLGSAWCWRIFLAGRRGNDCFDSVRGGSENSIRSLKTILTRCAAWFLSFPVKPSIKSRKMAATLSAAHSLSFTVKPWNHGCRSLTSPVGCFWVIWFNLTVSWTVLFGFIISNLTYS